MSILLKALYTEVHKYILDCNDSLDKVNNYLVDPFFPKQIWYVLLCSYYDCISKNACLADL